MGCAVICLTFGSVWAVTPGDLAGRSFIVGGGSRGLGHAIATEIVERSGRVLLVARDAAALERAVDELGADNARACAADLGAPGAAEQIADAAGAAFGDRLDGVVVNGGGPPIGPALDLDDDTWRGAYELLLGGPLRLLRLLVPRLAEGGSVLFVTSSSVRQPIAGLDTSNVLRPGVAALAKTLAIQLGPRGIRVNSIAPGRFDTDRVRELDGARAAATGNDVDELRAETAAAIPLRRYGDPAEFAHAAVFLLSDAASYVSGVALGVDGAAVTAQP
jgi:3-oxoacyl-[acyl-carrier protein] reductase